MALEEQTAEQSALMLRDENVKSTVDFTKT